MLGIAFRYIETEAPGGFGIKTKIDTSVHPPIVEKFHFEFDGWVGDDILETFPCYAVSKPLKDKIELDQLTGVIFADVLVTKSDTFIELYPDKVLPEFFWAKIVGEIFKDDFFIAEDNRLMISDKAFQVLSDFNIGNALF